MLLVRGSVLLLFAATTVFAQKPVISPGGIVSAADFVAPAAHRHALAPGSLASIFGENLANGTFAAYFTPLETVIN